LGADGLLLVQNLRRNGLLDWSTPGGVIDEGETVLEGLTREVVEETGLTVEQWHGPLYEVHALAPDMEWRLRVEVHLATHWSGEITIDDPDEIVVDADFVSNHRSADLLAGSQPWVTEPLIAWLDERWSMKRTFSYRVEGTDRAMLKVTRE
jgi:8-oxo-dGTP diphosphatase